MVNLILIWNCLIGKRLIDWLTTYLLFIECLTIRFFQLIYFFGSLKTKNIVTQYKKDRCLMISNTLFHNKMIWILVYCSIEIFVSYGFFPWKKCSAVFEFQNSFVRSSTIQPCDDVEGKRDNVVIESLSICLCN